MSGLIGAAFGPIAGIAQTAIPVLTATGLLPSWLRAARSIDTIIPDVTIEENHSDRLTVTQHPIAIGSPVSDHAYKNPATITMRIGFTNANPIGSAIEGFQSGGGFSNIGGGLAGAVGIDPTGAGKVLSGDFSNVSGALTGGGLLGSAMEQRCKMVYAKLVKLQFDSELWAKGAGAVAPFKLITGKRTYENVVITEITVRTDRTTEYSLMVEVHMQEVFIVKPRSDTNQPPMPDQSKAPSTASADQHPPEHPTEEEHPPGRTPSPLGRIIGVSEDPVPGQPGGGHH